MYENLGRNGDDYKKSLVLRQAQHKSSEFGVRSLFGVKTRR